MKKCKHLPLSCTCQLCCTTHRVILVARHSHGHGFDSQPPQLHFDGVRMSMCTYAVLWMRIEEPHMFKTIRSSLPCCFAYRVLFWDIKIQQQRSILSGTFPYAVTLFNPLSFWTVLPFLPLALFLFTLVNHQLSVLCIT